MNFVTQIATKIVDLLIVKTGEQLSYLFYYNTNINNLKDQSDNLSSVSDGVKRDIEAAQRNLEKIELKVEKWVHDVEHLTLDADKLLKADPVKANHRCFNGRCINLWSRYKFGKKACKMTRKITELQGTKFESVSYRAPLPKIDSSSSSKMFSAFESRKSIVRDVMEALNDKAVNVIGICGMGGVGKTTIVEEVRRQASEKKLFGEIVMVVVSQNASLTKVQEEVAKKLGLNLENRDEEERVLALWERIKGCKTILVVLDDVWSRIELREVGIPVGEDHIGCKILVTSRREDVCIGMNAQKIIPIKVLSEQEAWVLFKEKAGEAVDSSSDLNSIAREVARECGGLPIALVTVGTALRNRKKHEWRNAARLLKKHVPTKIEGMESAVCSSIELSYNYLKNEEERQCFLLCSLFPEDAPIPVETLVRYGMGLRLFRDVDTIEDARVSAHALVSTLVSSFLLLELTKGYTKMHDVVRDVAISIVSKEENNKYMVEARAGLREWPNSDASFQNYTGISLMENHIRQLPDGLECSKLEILLLQMISLREPKLEIPTNFFQGLKDLKVLDMSGDDISSFPPSILSLTSLRTLCLDDCRLDDISIIGALKQLEILSLSGSYIKEVPGQFAQLTCLKLFDLTYCSDLKQISPGVISSLCKLEELYIGNHFKYWQVEGEQENSRSNNASLAELKSLTQLNCLYFAAPNPEMLPHDLTLQNLTRFAIAIGNTTFSVKESLEKTLSLTFDTRLGRPAEALLKEAEGLKLQNCSGLKNILNDLDNESFVELKYLNLSVCNEIKYLLDTVDRVPRAAFHNLEELWLFNLENFSEIWHGQVLPAESFSKLRELSVSTCHSMLNILPFKLISRLAAYLQKIDVNNCWSLLNVFDFEGLATDQGGDNLDTELLSRLEKIEVSNLPELMHIWKALRDDHLFVNLSNLKCVGLEDCPKLGQLFPPPLVQGLVHLEELVVAGCINLEEIFGTHDEEDRDEEIVMLGKNRLSTSTTTLILQNLTNVVVSGCDKLRNIFSASVAKGLVQLKELGIASCAVMEAVVLEDEKLGEAATVSIERLVFPRLRAIRLCILDNLTCFCTGHYAVEYPSLEEMLIFCCPKMVTFGHGVQTTPKLKKVQVQVNDDETDDEGIWLGELNATIQRIFNQKEEPQLGAQSDPC